MLSLSSITAHLLHEAGILQGMRVLDIGCGSGEVTRAVASLVGPSGLVVGVDGSEPAIAAAETATRASGDLNIRYMRCDLSALGLEAESFDCVVGRRVLMYLQDPSAVIARLLDLVRPGGTLAFQEHDGTMTPGRIGDWPLHDRVHRWIWETLRREGANPHLGLSLAPMLTAAGASVESVWAQAVVAGYEHGAHHPLHAVLEAMLGRLVAHGVATEVEVDLPTLESRLAIERNSHTSCYVGDMAVCVIARWNGRDPNEARALRPPAR